MCKHHNTVIKFVLLTTNHYILNIRSSQYILLHLFEEKRKIRRGVHQHKTQSKPESKLSDLNFFNRCFYVALDLPLNERGGNAKFVALVPAGTECINEHTQTFFLIRVY